MNWLQSRTRWQAVLLILSVCLVSNAALLDDFVRLLRATELAVGGWDIPTHFMRMLHARELYLPSGHRFGWDPFWFQGYVPFLLYPHLTYVGLAALSLLVPVDPARFFNAYILAVYFALPIVGGLAVLSRLGAAPALVVSSWFSVLSTTAVGLTGVFVVGLLSQQAGLIVFTLFAVDLLLTRRPERAAIWLGLTSLVHVHTFLVSSFLWGCIALVDLAAASDRRGALRSWLVSSLLAFGIALPAAVGFAYGWSHVGNATTFGPSDRLFMRLLEGTLVAPQPVLIAILICLFVPFPEAEADKRRRWRICAVLGLVLVAVSVYRGSVGIPLVDRVLATMLYARTLPFAFIWLSIAAIARWLHLSTTLRSVVVLLSFAAILIPRHQEDMIARKIGSIWRSLGKENAVTVADYRRVLRWIKDDTGDRTSTVAVKVSSPHSPWLVAAVQTTGQPLLGGHGVELTSINNQEVLHRPLEMSCQMIRQQVQHYAVGYLVGKTPDIRAKFEQCLARKAAFVRDPWWVVTTGHTWDQSPTAAIAFDHDATWTNLEWQLRPPIRPARMRLPIVDNTNWHAEVDGQPVSIETTDDHMMQVTLPAEARSLRLRYEGYFGEWLSVAAALVFLGVAVRRARA